MEAATRSAYDRSKFGAGEDFCGLAFLLPEFKRENGA
jgi:hypothetical protein